MKHFLILIAFVALPLLAQQGTMICKIKINDTVVKLDIGDFKSILSSVSKSNVCAQGHIKEVPRSGMVYKSGSPIGKDLSNGETDDLVDSLEVPCKKFVCTPFEAVVQDGQLIPLKKNDLIVDLTTFQRGEVREAFADGRSYSFFPADTSKLFFRAYPSQIAKQIECFKEFCVGSEVAPNERADSAIQYQRMTITEVYSNGLITAVSQTDSSTYWLLTSTYNLIGKPVRELNGIRVGMRVIDNGDDATGTVKEILPNGVFKIFYEKEPSRLYSRVRSQIAPAAQ